MARFDQCIAAMNRAVGRKLTDREAEAVAQALEDNIRKQGGTSPHDIMRAVKDLGDELKIAASIAKRNILLNKLSLQTLREDVAQFSNKGLGVEAQLGGVNAIAPGARNSAGAQQKALFDGILGGISADLRRAGPEFLGLFTSRDMERLIANELWKRGSTKDPRAKIIADIIEKHREAFRLRENRAGSWIAQAENFIASQSHNSSRITRAGFDKWRTDILPKLDAEKTFRGANPETFLKRVWDNIARNEHETIDGPRFEGVAQFLGSGNLARKRSQQRQLIFNSADDWLDYNSVYGVGSLTDALLSDFSRRARAIGLMEKFGPNAEANARLINKEQIDASEPSTKEGQASLKRLQSRRFDNIMAELTGRTNTVVNHRAAEWGSAIRAVQSMSKLGGAMISSFADLATVSSELRFQGRGFLSSYGEALTGLVSGRRTGEKRIIADLIGVGFDGLTGTMLSRFHSTDSPPGRMTRLLGKFFKFNGLAWWTDAHKTTAGLVTSRYFALMREKALPDLPPESQRLLRLYGIGEEGWNIIRRSETRVAEDGTAFLTPDSIGKFDPETFRSLAGQRLGDVADVNARFLLSERDKLASAYQALLVDRAEFAVPTPGAREKAFLNQGTERGTLFGETLRFVAQFKGFPTAVLLRPLGRDLQARGVMGVIDTIVNMTIFGYLAMSAKDLLKGKDARDPLDVRTWLAAAQQGGGLGLYGDFLFGEFDRFGRSAAPSLVGPTIGGTADTIIKLWAKAIRGEDVGATLLKAVRDNTPFANLFYLKPALDYGIIYNLQERMNPGYLRRLERQQERDTGQTFLFPPSTSRFGL